MIPLISDTCDPSWQPTRDDLIIAAHVISDLAFLVEVVAAGFVCVAVCCGIYCKSMAMHVHSDVRHINRTAIVVSLPCVYQTISIKIYEVVCSYLN